MDKTSRKPSKLLWVHNHNGDGGSARRLFLFFRIQIPLALEKGSGMGERFQLVPDPSTQSAFQK